MYEFDSVSVSSFEAGSLADTLTERSADGWDVVAVVPAGSDVVAYLRRATVDTEAVDDTGPVVAEAAATGEAAAEDVTPAAAPASDLLSTDEAGIEAQPVDADATPAESATAADAGGTGWAAVSDTTAPTPSSGGSSTSESAAWGGSAQQSAAPSTPSTPSVPAGWYADPAGRFELRYWDGVAWTEHVSRAGQQFTDPPVA